MKQKLLALSVAASLGLAAGTAAAVPTVKVNGVGMINVIPYFSTQGSNVTQISITNTDMVNGKVVKVRFRGAEWSDDIFDFQVFLSPGDVFTGAVTNSGNVSKFETADTSCTLPTSVNQNFPTIRLHNTATGTLEGYVEVITMANINPAGTLAPVGTSAEGYSLYTATKHVNGVAPCKTAGSKAEAAVTTLKQDNAINALAAPDATTGQHPNWMSNPTTGLTSWNRVINISTVKAYGVPATAIDLTAMAGKWYFRQANEAVPLAANVNQMTSDRIFFPEDNFGAGAPTPNDATSAGTAITTLYQFDLPDLSTNFENVVAGVGLTAAATARNNMTSALTKLAVASEYSTLASVNAATDLVMTQPTRRYYYNYDAVTPASPTEGTNFSRTIGGSTNYYVIKGDATTAYANLDMLNRVGLADLDAAVAGVGNPVGYTATPAIFFDREEQFKAAQTDIVISPNPPAAAYTLSLKGEASVVSFNRGSGATETGALGGKLTMNDISIVGGYQAGWVLLSTKAKTNNNPLPIIGFGATNVAGVHNYGTTLPLRYFGATGAIAQ